MAHNDHDPRNHGLGAGQLDERELGEQRVVRDMRDDAQDDFELGDVAFEEQERDVDAQDPEDHPAKQPFYVLAVLFNKVCCIV